MEFYIARRPVFNRRREVFGYKLELCPSLRDRFYAMYREPDDAEELYRRLCLAGFDGSADKPAAILDMAPHLLESLVPLLPRKHVVVEYTNTGNSEMSELKEIQRLKAQGYRILYETAIVPSLRFLGFIDLIKLDTASMSLEQQYERVKADKGSALFYAGGIDSWEDYKKALVLGLRLLSGRFLYEAARGQAKRAEVVQRVDPARAERAWTAGTGL